MNRYYHGNLALNMRWEMHNKITLLAQKLDISIRIYNAPYPEDFNILDTIHAHIDKLEMLNEVRSTFY